MFHFSLWNSLLCKKAGLTCLQKRIYLTLKCITDGSTVMTAGRSMSRDMKAAECLLAENSNSVLWEHRFISVGLLQKHSLKKCVSDKSYARFVKSNMWKVHWVTFICSAKVFTLTCKCLILLDLHWIYFWSFYAKMSVKIEQQQFLIATEHGASVTHPVICSGSVFLEKISFLRICRWPSHSHFNVNYPLVLWSAIYNGYFILYKIKSHIQSFHDLFFFTFYCDIWTKDHLMCSSVIETTFLRNMLPE